MFTYEMIGHTRHDTMKLTIWTQVDRADVNQLDRVASNFMHEDEKLVLVECFISGPTQPRKMFFRHGLEEFFGKAPDGWTHVPAGAYPAR